MEMLLKGDESYGHSAHTLLKPGDFEGVLPRGR